MNEGDHIMLLCRGAVNALVSSERVWSAFPTPIASRSTEACFHVGI